MHARALIRLQTRLEYGVEITDGLIPVTDANRGDVPRLTVARHEGGYTLLPRADLPQDVLAQLADVDPATFFNHPALAGAILPPPAAHPIALRWYVFSRAPDRSEFPLVVPREGRFEVRIEGRTVAAAWSDRENAEAAEVEVETLAGYRGRGFGRQVVAAWAAAVVRAGKTAFYSHRLENKASAALARSLGLTPYAETVEYP